MSSNSSKLEENSSHITLIGLPQESLQQILGYLSYDQLSNVRAVYRKIRTVAEGLLNSGFTQLGQEIEQASALLRKHLPRRESARRAHRLNNYAEVFSALEARYTLLSMTYKKFIECGYCCFIPGKVLDEAFCVIRRLNKDIHMAINNENQFERLPHLNSIELLKDFKDYSSMAMEHFDENIAVRFPNKYMLALSGNRRLSDPFPARHFGINKTAFNKTGLTMPQIKHNNLTSNTSNVSLQFELFKTDVNRRLSEQSRIIQEQDKVIKEHSETINRILSLLSDTDRASLFASSSIPTSLVQESTENHKSSEDDGVILADIAGPSISKKSYNLRKRNANDENKVVKKFRRGI